MKTDVIVVSSKGARMEEALKEVDKVAGYKGLSHKSALHLRLLTEEMMGLMRSITGETEGCFWIEDQDNVYELHLQTTTRMTSLKREKLLSAATSGKNESAKGFMGHIRDFFDRGADEDIAAYGSPLLMAGAFEKSSTPALDWEWSMTRYEDELRPSIQRQDAAALAAWDELEKSVVARVADDVKVSIKGRTAEVTIVKKITE
ncbi:MAG: hypothetical protein IKR36_02985 [Clostridia bacterium]|nr:hypothetical protein [Clostridia bacterium]